MTKKWAVAVILVLMSAAIAAPLVTRLYMIKTRWLLWTPVSQEVWLWPVGEPNDIEYYARREVWLDPNQTDINWGIHLPKKTDGRDRIMRTETRIRFINLREYAITARHE